MKAIKFSMWTLGLIVSVLSFGACNTDSDDNQSRKTALVTVYPQSSGGFSMQLDSIIQLVPSNMSASPFGTKRVRALVSYTDEGLSNEYTRHVRIHWIDSIRTKLPVLTTGMNDAVTYGNDPIEIVRDWVSVAEDGFLTLRVRTLWGNGNKHVINLVSGVNKDNAYELTLRHNAQGDTHGQLGDALIAFDLNSLWANHPDKVEIKLNWKSFSGQKSIELTMGMHSSAVFDSVPWALFCNRLE